MKILFVHQNFPGQFLHLAPALAARGHEVVALTDEDNRRPSPVRTLRYRKPPAVAGDGIGRHYGEMAERGLAVARAARQLGESGFVPDIVFGHSGWGEPLFLREVWPAARQLAYAEFCYRGAGLDVGFDPEFQSGDLGARIGAVARRTHLVQGLVDADAAVTPTAWQRASYPEILQGRIRVIHDGIDTETVCPDPTARLVLPDGVELAPGDEVVSFVSRNLEPYRGLHIFLRALPEVLAARPGARVVVIGGEERGYGPLPAEGGSWKARFLDELDGRLDLSRVHFLGKVPYATYLALLRVSRAHAYLTYPFVLSWSLLEAMSAGAPVIASRTPPVEEVIADGRNGRLVDFFDVAGWSGALIDALRSPETMATLREEARRTMVERYDLKRLCLPALLRFVESGGA
ncbi:MAG: glycosyltransferase [Defluviimonas sp.]|uniref:glycosyltransferase n=1 Tax=Albidovulum sp. TaxID=1872424 RepID=UPI001DCB112A|nr:glycosyltransferase [Paracoccaceae bacterium]MCC0065302.1 glycosyltransferase [Defluviimonas sp.]